MSQMEWITNVPYLDVNQVNNFSSLSGGGGGGSTLSAGAWAGIVIGILAFFSCTYWVKRRQRTILRARAQRQADKVNQSLQQQREQLAGHVFPDLNGSIGVGSEQKGGTINGAGVFSSPSSPPPLRPRPQQSPPASERLLALQTETAPQDLLSTGASPGISYQPYTPTAFQSPPGTSYNNSHPVVDDTSREHFRQTLQLSSHPKPRVVTTTRTPTNNS